jgi:hypothetical protein
MTTSVSDVMERRVGARRGGGRGDAVAVDEVPAHDAVVGVVHDDLAGAASLGERVGHSLSLFEVAASERTPAVGEYHLPLATGVEQDADRERVDRYALRRV